MDGKQIIARMFECNAFEKRYNGIIEIFPHRAMSTFTLDAALYELSKTHDIVQMFPDWLRAFEKGGTK